MKEVITMIFIGLALAFAIATVHFIYKGEEALALMFLVLSAVIPLLAQEWYDSLRRDSHRGDTHRGGNGAAPIIISEEEEGDRTLQLLDKMDSDLKEIKEDLTSMVHMSQELRMCLIPSSQSLPED